LALESVGNGDAGHYRNLRFVAKKKHDSLKKKKERKQKKQKRRAQRKKEIKIKKKTIKTNERQ
jgi:hypothetical protein